MNTSESVNVNETLIANEILTECMNNSLNGWKGYSFVSLIYPAHGHIHLFHSLANVFSVQFYQEHGELENVNVSATETKNASLDDTNLFLQVPYDHTFLRQHPFHGKNLHTYFHDPVYDHQ